jgi:hypothetical protein
MKTIILVISAITLIALSAPQASAGWKGTHNLYDPDRKGYRCEHCMFAHRKNAKGQKQYRHKRTGRPKTASWRRHHD